MPLAVSSQPSDLFTDAAHPELSAVIIRTTGPKLTNLKSPQRILRYGKPQQRQPQQLQGKSWWCPQDLMRVRLGSLDQDHTLPTVHRFQD